MFSFYLAAANVEMTLGEKLSLGGQVALLGMGTVFAVLAILWGLVELLHLLLTGFSGDKKKKAAPAATPAAAPVPAAETPASADDLEIIAVITAAVAAASGTSPSSFRVVSFKRANSRFSSGK